MACSRAIGDADTLVCLSAKQIIPAISIRIELITVSVVPDPLAPTLTAVAPAMPKLKISNSAPKIIPLIPASDSNRLVASCAQCSAPIEQISSTASTTMKEAVKLVGKLRG